VALWQNRNLLAAKVPEHGLDSLRQLGRTSQVGSNESAPRGQRLGQGLGEPKGLAQRISDQTRGGSQVRAQRGVLGQQLADLGRLSPSLFEQGSTATVEVRAQAVKDQQLLQPPGVQQRGQLRVV
jgi:hypothetical protein